MYLFRVCKWFFTATDITFKHNTTSIYHSVTTYNIHAPSTQHITHSHWTYLYRLTLISHIAYPNRPRHERTHTTSFVYVFVTSWKNVGFRHSKYTCLSANSHVSLLWLVFFYLYIHRYLIVYCSTFEFGMRIVSGVHVLLLLPYYPIPYMVFLPHSFMFHIVRLLLSFVSNAR